MPLVLAALTRKQAASLLALTAKHDRALYRELCEALGTTPGAMAKLARAELDRRAQR